MLTPARCRAEKLTVTVFCERCRCGRALDLNTCQLGAVEHTPFRDLVDQGRFRCAPPRFGGGCGGDRITLLITDERKAQTSIQLERWASPGVKLYTPGADARP